MSILTLDYNYQTGILMNSFQRDILERYDWMRLQSFPLVLLNNSFDSTTFNPIRFQSLHTSQILSLEHFLNTVLSPSLPITITDGIYNDETYLFIRDELFSEPTYMFTRAEAAQPLYFFTREELDEQGIDFIVNLSGTDSGLQTKLKAYIEYFRPAGKKYQINVY